MVKLALLEKGADFEMVHVHGSQDEAFLAISPREGAGAGDRQGLS